MLATEKLPHTLKDQLKAAREAAGIYDASAYGQFFASGPDAAGYLHRMLSNEVQKMAVGEGRYQGLLDRKGMTLSLFYLKRLGPQEFLGVTPPQLREKTVGTLTKMKFIEKVTIVDATPERGLLFLIGPKADALRALIAESTPLLIWGEEIFGLPWITVSGPKAEIVKIRTELEGKVATLGSEAVRLLRMAANFPEYGIDLDEGHILLETPVPVAHQRNKGCYPGQEVIERISTYGKGRAPRRLCLLKLSGEKDLPKGTSVTTAGGHKAGYVTSALFNPLDGVTQVLASLETKFADEILADVGQCQFLPPTPL